jgi:hypothetical protein
MHRWTLRQPVSGLGVSQAHGSCSVLTRAGSQWTDNEPVPRLTVPKCISGGIPASRGRPVQPARSVYGNDLWRQTSPRNR